jgi:hypothetical protein
VNGILKSNPNFVATKAETRTPPATENLTERMRRLKAEKNSPQSKALSASVTENPWVTGNLTKQMMLLKHDPARAQRLKNLAKGGRA